MPLSLQSRRVGDITVVKCRGRIVEGAESAALSQHLTDRLSDGPHIVLDLGDVAFLDSAGLGLLVLWLSRVQAARGRFTLCALPPHIVEVLRVTKLRTVLESYASEEEAIAACYRSGRSPDAVYRFTTDILCVEPSDEVLAYVRQLLGQAGYGVVTASNLPDGLVLLMATQPKVVVMGAALRAQRGTQTADKFTRLAEARAVVELPVGFSTRDAGDAGRHLLDQVRALTGGRS